LELSTIEAEGDIRAEYMQDATLRSQGRVEVERYVSRCIVQASGPVVIHNNEGMVRGGSIWSETAIRSNVAGSTACVPTTLMVKPILNEAQEKTLQSLNEQLQSLGERQQQLRRRLDYLSMLARRQNRLGTKHQQEAELLSEELITVSEKILDMEEQVHVLYTSPRSERKPENPVIQVRQKIYPGVLFIIGDKELLIQEELSGGVVEVKNDQIYLREIPASLPKKMHFESRTMI